MAGPQDSMEPAGESAVDVVVEQIRGMIVADGLSVGDRLPTERELCDRFSTSRNTVREAMRILKAYGMVDVRPKVGARIVDNRMSRAFDLFALDLIDINRETFQDIQGFRTLLEVGSVELIFDRLTPDDIAELRAVNQRLAGVASMAEGVAVDFDLHTRLVGLMGNKSVLEVYQIMKPVILRIMETGKTLDIYRTRILDEHASVIDALEARDRIAYQYLMKTHLEAGLMHFRSRDGAALRSVADPDASERKTRRETRA